MRALFVLLRNVAVALLSAFQSLWRALLRTKPVEWVAYELDGQVGRGQPEDHVSWALRLPRGAKVRHTEHLARELAFLRELPSVRGVVFRLKEVHCTGAVLLELRTLLAEFRAAGKQVVVHADNLGLRDYWLASAANRVLLMPRGRLDLVGLAAASSAAARPLAKVGMRFDIIRAGQFKSAGELMGAEKVSPEQQHQMDVLLGDMHDLVVADIAEGRGLPQDEVRRLIDEGPYNARGALSARLVDGLLYADEVRESLDLHPPEGPRRARLGPFSAALAAHAPPADWRPLRDTRPTIAVLDVEGIIAPGKSRTLPALGETAGSDTLVAQLTKLRREKDVEAVVLRIDSRGGSALASDLIWHAAVRLAKEKPVVAFLDNVAASGGYYIAAAAQRIVAAPTCITGSIGVFLSRPDASGVYRKLEIDHAVVKRGRHATILRPDQPLSDEERETLQRDVLETYGDFVQVVAEGRKMSESRVRELAEGRIYLAPRARTEGLVDEVGPLALALDEAKRLAKITGDVQLLRVRSRQAGWRELYRTLRRDGARGLLRILLAPPADRVQALWTGELPL